MLKLITFEGIDGSGKSTLAKIVFKEISKKYKAVLTFEPTKSIYGKLVATSINSNSSDVFLETISFITDHAYHTTQINKWHEKNKIVISDRYNDSNYAYQSVILRNKIRNPLQWLIKIQEPFTIIPDITFLLIIEPEIALQRIKRKKTKFENIEFLIDVQKNYLKLAKLFKDRYIILDGKKSITELTKKCLYEIKKHINANYRR